MPVANHAAPVVGARDGLSTWAAKFRSLMTQEFQTKENKDRVRPRQNDSGCDSMAAKGRNVTTSQGGNVGQLAKIARKPRISKGKVGGGEWSRTTDAADMSRVDSDETTLH